MIICLCAGIDDEDLDALAARGVVGAEAIGRACEAGRHCGACVEDLDRRCARGPRGARPASSPTLDTLDPMRAA